MHARMTFLHHFVTFSCCQSAFISAQSAGLFLQLPPKQDASVHHRVFWLFGTLWFLFLLPRSPKTKKKEPRHARLNFHLLKKHALPVPHHNTLALLATESSTCWMSSLMKRRWNLSIHLTQVFCAFKILWIFFLGIVTEWWLIWNATDDGLYDCAWSEENENHLVSVCGDGSVKVWDLEALENPLKNLAEHKNEAYSVDWNLVGECELFVFVFCFFWCLESLLLMLSVWK